MHQINCKLAVEDVKVCCFKLMWLFAQENLIKAELSSPKTY